MARPKNPQDTKSFEVTLPRKAHGYLAWMANNSVDGATVNEVAATLLKEKVKELLAAKYHETFIPDGSESAADERD